jgi:hypothetical protein
VSIADRYAREALEALCLARWCYEHRSTLFFCEHRHAEDPAVIRERCCVEGCDSPATVVGGWFFCATHAELCPPF